jgi:hypothetical protein
MGCLSTDTGEGEDHKNLPVWAFPDLTARKAATSVTVGGSNKAFADLTPQAEDDEI